MTKITTPVNESFFKFISQDNDIYRFFRENIRFYHKEEKLIHIAIGFLMLAGLGLYSLNLEVFHFTTLYLSLKMMTGFPILLLIWWFIGRLHHSKWPRFGLLATTCANLCLFGIMAIIGFAAIVATPFVIIDYHLIHWDQLLGFNLTAVMAWAHQFPYLIKALWFGYNTWLYQVLLTPILLAVLKKEPEISQYFITGIICFIFWIFIYYFFPTIAPAGVMHSPYFVADQFSLVTRYYEIHQSLPISTYQGGMVSFPSGHVMYALLVLIALRKVKLAFYPMVIINSLLIFATMALGYHYLVDVLASFFIVSFALIVHRLIVKLLAKP